MLPEIFRDQRSVSRKDWNVPMYVYAYESLRVFAKPYAKGCLHCGGFMKPLGALWTHT